MSDIKLFRIVQNGVEEIHGTSVAVEKSLQKMIEDHLEVFLGVRFLATEYVTGRTHGGRIDTLGIDENNCPVIIEYKKALNENVINQGLFYLDWLLDHKAEFQLLVLKRFGEEVANGIEWSDPRLVCIAGNFTRYDEHAVQQIARNIELVRYRRYGDHLVLFELVTAASGETLGWTKPTPRSNNPPLNPGVGHTSDAPEVLRRLEQCLPIVHDRYEALRAYLLALGDDVQVKTVDRYIAFRRLKNFAAVRFRPQTGRMLLYVNVRPDTIKLEPGFTKDHRPTGGTGTWQLEITIDDDDDLKRAKPLVTKSYEAS